MPILRFGAGRDVTDVSTVFRGRAVRGATEEQAATAVATTGEGKMSRYLRMIGLMAAGGLVYVGIGACNPGENEIHSNVDVTATVKSLAKGTGVAGVTVTFTMVRDTGGYSQLTETCVTEANGTCQVTISEGSNQWFVSATKGTIHLVGNQMYIPPDTQYEFLTNAFD